MRKVLFFLLIPFISICSIAQTPSWTWAIGIGGTSGDNGYGITSDVNGNIYVTGYFANTMTVGSTTLTSAGFRDFFIIKYTAAGTVVWAVSAGGTNNDEGQSIAVDANGNVYIGGTFISSTLVIGTTTLTHSGNGDAFFAKYNSSGIPQWAVAAGGASQEHIGRVATDVNGNLFAIGTFLSSSLTIGSTTLTSAGSRDVYIVKFGTTGNVAWATSAGGINGDWGYGITTDATGNWYVTGEFDSPSITFGTITLVGGDLFTVKYDPAGNVIWATQGLGDAGGFGISTDANGNVYVAGNFFGPFTFGSTTLPGSSSIDFFICKHNSSGSPLWAVAATGSGVEFPTGIKTDAAGNSYAIGYTNSSTLNFGTNSLNYGSTNQHAFVVKYNSSGNDLWAMAPSSSGHVWGRDISLETNGDCIITGTFNSTTNFGSISLTANTEDIFVARISEGCTSAPPQPGTISGNNSVCQGSSQTYSISPVSGATSYTWTLPSGWTGTSTTTSITATAGANGGNIAVTANNSCGSSTAQTLAVTVNSIPVQPGVITGSNSVCQGSSQTYSISAVSGATSYTWSLPAGWTGISTTTSITATVGANGGNIAVTAINGCGSSTAQTLAVTVNSIPVQPGVITGTNSVCQGSSQTYSISAVSGTTSYTWSLPTGWTGTSITTSITATVGANGGNITVTANNGCGSSTAQTLAVTVSAVPAQPGTITGNISVNVGQTLNYSISPPSGATGYNWSLSGGGNITSGQNTTSVSINWTIPGNYTISVNANNNCGTSTTQAMNITVSIVTVIIDPGNGNRIKLFPNPTTGNIYLKAQGMHNKQMSIQLFDLLGRSVYTTEQRVNSNDYTLLIDLGHVPAGMYQAKIFVDKKIYVRTIVKMNSP